MIKEQLVKILGQGFCYIAGQRWKILTGQEVDAILEAANGLGLCSSNGYTIMVKTEGMDMDHKVEILIHEMLHAIVHNSGLGKGLLEDGSEGKLEESIVTALSSGLMEIFKAN